MPTEDEKKKNTFNLQNTPQSFADLGPDGREGMGLNAGTNTVTPRQPSSASEQAFAEANSVANDPEMRSAYLEQSRTAAELNKEALRNRKFENENAGRRNPTSLRTIEARERAAQKREAAAAAEAQRKEDFWNQGKANERPEVKAAREARNVEFQSQDKARTAARNTRLKEAVQPMVAKRDAGNAARVSEAKRRQDPQARLDSLASRQGLMGGRLNFAEVKQGDGRSAMYVAPTAAGSQAYVNAKVNPRMAQQSAALGERAMGVTPQMPPSPPALPQGLPAAPAPAPSITTTPSRSMVGMPTFDPSKLVVGSPAPARPQPPADPNAAAAIASFNQSAAQQPRGSSPAQNANLQNLQRGNLPTLANVVNVPGKIAGAVGGALKSYGSAVATSPGANFVRDVATGKTPLVAGAKPAAPKPSYQTTTPGGSPMTTSVKPEPVISPRRVVQAANRDKKNPLMVN